MATKPTVHAEWDTNNTNVSATTSGHKSDGWANNEVPTAAEMNYWMKEVSDWTKWVLEAQINDGTANYSLTANTANADLTGGGNLTNIHTVYVTPTAEWTIHGIQYGVDKQEIQLINTGSYLIWLADESGSATAANRLTMPTVYSQETPYIHLLPGGAAKLRYHGSSSRWKLVSATNIRVCRRILLPANMLGYDDSASSHTMSTGQTQAGSVIAGYMPVVVPTGSLIYGYRSYFKKTSSGSYTVSTRMYKRAGNSDTVTGLASSRTNNTNAPGYIALGEAAGDMSEEVDTAVPTTQFFIEFASTNTSSIDLFLHADVIAFIPQ